MILIKVDRISQQLLPYISALGLSRPMLMYYRRPFHLLIPRIDSPIITT